MWPVCFSQVAFQHFQELDEHVSYVATKVCHLGDLLEGVNTPRQRLVEAHKLMKYFNEFLDGELKSDVFTNPEKVKPVSGIEMLCAPISCVALITAPVVTFRASLPREHLVRAPLFWSAD